MPAAARAEKKSNVFSLTGRGRKCAFPIRTTSDDIGSTRVIVNGYQAVKLDDPVKTHSKKTCIEDTSILTSGSSKVYVEGKPMGILGGKYTSDNIIISGSRTVFVGS